ncbi:MAG: hypothetical protein PVS3B1_25150 [Ktedonobacteraceae bacterium]
MRIETLTASNSQTQGATTREWLRQYAPQHLQYSAEIVARALSQRTSATSRSTLVMGAGASTEVPLANLLRASEEVVLADMDLAAMQRGRDEVASPALRRHVRFVQCDLTGGVSSKLRGLMRKQDWRVLAAQESPAIFDAAALCLEQCLVPDPPHIHTLRPGDFGLVVSSLVLSQLFSYPLLDILDDIKTVDPDLLVEQERHRRYQEAAQAFRVRIINAHLHLMRDLLDSGGVAVLLSDIRGFAFNVHGTDHDATHRRYIPLVPRIFPKLVQGVFSIEEEAKWDWLTDLPAEGRIGRGYEVAGYVLKPMG